MGKIRRALVSVYDKTDLIPFARALRRHKVEIISTGGTLKALKRGPESNRKAPARQPARPPRGAFAKGRGVAGFHLQIR